MKHKSILVVIVLALCVALVGTAVAQEGSEPQQPEIVVTTKFTHQGQIQRNNALFTGTCDMQFKLWDAASGGTQSGITLSANIVPVNNGVFIVELDFGNQFKGEARWLEVAAKCADDAGFTTMPRVPLTPSPYAIGLLPGAQMLGSIPGSAGILRATNNGAGAALVGLANSSTGATYGVLGNAFSPNGYAVLGYANGGATGVQGWSDSSGTGVWGRSATGAGVLGESANFNGVRGVAHNANHGAVVGIHDGGGFGVYGTSTSGSGVVGISTSWVGVYGESASQTAVWGKSTSATGVYGSSSTQIGVYGESASYEGVRGISHNANHGGVVGVNDAAGIGIYGETSAAHSYSKPGIYGKSIGNGGIGVIGEANVGNGWGVYGISTAGSGVVGQSTTGYAGYFIGKVGITGGADLAERFATADNARVEPGTVMVIDEDHADKLKVSDGAYDGKVIGIISGAGGINTGLTLHQAGALEGDLIVAIAGRVYCQAEAHAAPIKPGDMLTTSSVKGYCMKAADRDRAYGAVIGKALTGLDHGEGLVLVIVNLQ